MKSSLALTCAAAAMALEMASAFAPSSMATGAPGLRRAAISTHRPRVLGLRCAEEKDSSPEPGSPRYVKLETTQTSWQGWGSSAETKQRTQFVVDPSDPQKAVQQALDAARESDGISKYLGGTESKTRAGITGDVEIAKLEGDKLVLRLTGNFWHNRQMVFSEVSTFIKQSLPAGTVVDIVIEDEKQLQGFAETSRHFEQQEKVTEEDLRKLAAKGKNIYGEELKNPFADFRRKKLADQAKFEEEQQRRRELDKADDATQLAAILDESNAANMFTKADGSKVPDDDIRPEDILAKML
eukprot:CAMPEP_0206247334 /NCGR_PEP_ID=MMETSP0047_2-20121206/19754_1 /ASSEMBLY_ACC=CAM_ASM_000192 /TAXON_ID=195065 /ORGANISM="Chroomonas mesostigmatica_cf, Strain CCMP1168" /LENGTH=296 /DNA_ID=CAMNT_0053672851 /DNA_START=15 /DNA_END=905 /DNA_ORIENTATION=-